MAWDSAWLRRRCAFRSSRDASDCLGLPRTDQEPAPVVPALPGLLLLRGRTRAPSAPAGRRGSRSPRRPFQQPVGRCFAFFPQPRGAVTGEQAGVHPRNVQRRAFLRRRLQHEELSIAATDLDPSRASRLVEQRGELLPSLGVGVGPHVQTPRVATPACCAARASRLSRVRSDALRASAASST